MAGGAGRLAMGALMSGPGLIAVAGVVALTAAVMAYRKEVNEAKKASQETFSVGSKTAEAYGYELTKVNEKIKENAQLTKDLGIGFTQTVSTVVPEEKRAAIVEDNKNLIATMQERVNDRVQAGSEVNNAKNAALDGKIKSSLLGKYATLRQQGVSVEDANEIITTIAREAGDETLSILSNIRPQLEKMNGDNFNEVFKESQRVQLESLKNLETGGPGGGEAFAEALLASVSVVQYAPPADQLDALNNLITNMKEFNADQIVLAAEALKTAAAETYGTESEFGKTLQTLTTTDNKTQAQQKEDTILATRLMTAEQQGILN